MPKHGEKFLSPKNPASLNRVECFAQKGSRDCSSLLAGAVYWWSHPVSMAATEESMPGTQPGWQQSSEAAS